MKIYAIKTSLKDKSTKDIFGFKTVTDVVIARDGTQTYLESELKEGGDPLKEVTVHRLTDDVKSSIMAIDGKPIVNLHPHKDMEFNDLPTEVIGVAMNTRFKDGKVIADLVFYKDYDNAEISLGYDANIVFRDGEYYQTDIVVNHVAIVPKGRCGKICKITDKGIKLMKINDKDYKVNDAVEAHVDALNVKIKDLETKAENAEANGIKLATEKAKLFKKAKDYKVEVKADASNFEIKQKIVDSIDGLTSKDKSEEYCDAVLDTHSISSFEPKKVTDSAKIEALKELKEQTGEF